ncbi:unnamed protein product, partial [marine sediment metagenome]
MGGPITAEEFIKKLERDPEYQARMKEKEKKRLKIAARNRRDSTGVLSDLAKIGFPVETVSELFNRKLWYEQAIPVLIKWLPKMKNTKVKESIVRALTVKWAKPQAAPLLVREYDKHTKPEDSALRWAISNALCEVADDSVCDDVIRLAQDRRYGPDRQMLMLVLGNMKDERVLDVLIGLLGDDDVAGHAIMGLRKLKAERARPHIEPFLEHPRRWVRK